MSKNHNVNEKELARLNQKEKNYWILTIVLLVVLSSTVIIQYLSSFGFVALSFAEANHYRNTLSVGLPGLVILFCLYTTAKRREIQYLKNTLYSQQFLLRKLAERTGQLESTLEELKKVGELKDMLLSTVSHELQTPLASIYTISQTLLNYEGDEATTQKFYRLISEESHRLSGLVRNLLDIAKMDSGTMTWDIQQHQPQKVLESAIAVSEVLSAAQNITLTYKSDDDLPHIPVDRDRMIQVLTNLIGNAIKFTPDGGSVVVTASTATDQAGCPTDAVRFSVRDNGVGIPPDHLGRIFERFHQAATPMGVRAKGTGLGLAISKDIVEHFGGEIWAESQPGVGSEFSFTIPTLPCGNDDPPQVEPPPPAEPMEIESPVHEPAARV